MVGGDAPHIGEGHLGFGRVIASETLIINLKSTGLTQNLGQL
jgi:hypothetical protein